MCPQNTATQSALPFPVLLKDLVPDLGRGFAASENEKVRGRGPLGGQDGCKAEDEGHLCGQERLWNLEQSGHLGRGVQVHLVHVSVSLSEGGSLRA